jgi:hypothetical protein
MTPARIAGATVIQFRPRLDAGFHMSSGRTATDISVSGHLSAFDRLTATLVIDQYRRGVLPEAVILALMAGVGILA